MQVGIIGLARSGKTTVFNAVTRGQAATGAYSASTEPNIGVVKVPDERLDRLSALFKPKKHTPADIHYVDFPGAGTAFGKGSTGPGSRFLADLGRCDALIHAVHAFDDPAVPHPEETVDPKRDIAAMELELAFADLALIEKRVERIQSEMKSIKASERGEAERELTLLRRMQAGIESEVPLRTQPFTDDERKLLSAYQFLTLKPLLVVLNVGDDAAGRTREMEAEIRGEGMPLNTEVAALAGKLEEELARLPEEEADQFRRELGLADEESSLARMILLSYALVGLISFFTAGEDECRAWTVRDGALAPEAAGKIHSDLERGFIRAEVVRWDDLLEAGSIAEARKRAKLRVEGKLYRVQDGDVMNILFNV
ncbi:MAG: redox-regulated ATPase YchF [Dehalococcoidia bacterium]|nr:redox-regulated ATPase YchF [Dehalococcoidia bacterium]